MTTIVTRSGKGSPLTHTEVDTNFTNLNTNKLEAGAIALGSAATPSISFTGDTNTGIYSPGADQVAVATNGTGRLFVDASGNVGVKGSTVITTSAVSAPTFQIGDGAGSPAVVMYSATTGASQISFADSTTGTGSYDGYILYNQSSQYLEFGTAASPRLRITSAGLVGIGTSSPSTTLDVRGSAQISGSSLNFSCIGDNTVFNVKSASNTLSYLGPRASSGVGLQKGYFTLADTGVNKIELDSAGPSYFNGGNVGIGVTAPGQLLQVGSSNGELRVGGISGLDITHSNANSTTAEIKQLYAATSDAAQLKIISGFTSFHTGTSGSERARIDSSGRLLVGTSTSRSNWYNATGLDDNLQIEGTTHGGSGFSIVRSNNFGGHIELGAHGGTTIGSYTLVSSGANLGSVSYQGTDGTTFVEAASITAAVDGTPGADDMPGRLVFSTTLDGAASPTERMRITNAGNLLVGTTTAGGRLAVASANSTVSPIATTSVTGDTAYQAILVTKFDNDTTTSQNFIQFQVNNGGANCGRITANGANTAAFGSTSDIRLKNNIEDLSPQLQNILSLRPVEFDYIESEGGGHQIGFIAQEMQAIFPDVVSERGEDDMLMITGWSKTEARLVKALQEAVAKIETLEARLTAAGIE